jgi:hypothetical protein
MTANLRAVPLFLDQGIMHSFYSDERDAEIERIAGPLLHCPNPGCGKPVGNMTGDRFYTRCKFCGQWILFIKIMIDPESIR